MVQIVKKYLIGLGIFIALLIGIKLFAPKILVRYGWETRYMKAVANFFNQETKNLKEIPVSSVHEVVEALKIKFPTMSPSEGDHLWTLKGPSLVSYSSCQIEERESMCLRYVWRGKDLNMSVTNRLDRFKPGKKSFPEGLQFNGYLVNTETLTLVLVGAGTSEELKEVWPATAGM